MPQKKKASAKAEVKKSETKTSKSASTTPKENEKKGVPSSLLAKVKKHKIALLIILIIAALAYLLFTFKEYIVAATVNGEPVYRYTLLTTSEQVAGPQILEQLVTQKIIDQEAQKRGITATQEDLDKAFEDLKEQYKSQGVDIKNLMEQNNVTREQLEKNLRPQVLQEKLIKNEGIAVTDEEVDKFFEDNPDLLPDSPEEIESSRENVKNSLKSQKVQAFMQKLRTEADVNYFVGK